MAEEIKHASRAHALLSASGAYRWMACTPSARLEESFKEDEESSVFAAEGTFAHELAELEIRYATDKISLNDFVEKKNEVMKHAFYTDEMVEEVDKYVANVLNDWRDAKKEDPFADIIIEDKFDLREWVPDGFGTNDIVIIAGSKLRVRDLKFGKGVKVSAKDNPQLKLYALGALEKHGIIYNIETVELVIDQPRLNNVSVFELTVSELNTWAEEVVIPTAKKAFEGTGEFVPGDHCRFCKAAVRCRALAEKNLEIAKYEFAEPALLDNTQLLDIFERAPAFVTWANKVSAFVSSEAIGGKVFPGYKLVEGRSNRSIANEEAAKFELRKTGLNSDAYLNSKLKGIGDLEKLLGKAEFAAVVGPYVVKPPGKPTLVSADDPRPAFSSIEQAKKDFE